MLDTASSVTLEQLPRNVLGTTRLRASIWMVCGCRTLRQSTMALKTNSPAVQVAMQAPKMRMPHPSAFRMMAINNAVISG